MRSAIARSLISPYSTIEITTQPQDVTLAIGKTAKFTVEATGDGVAYQWQVSTNGGSAWKDSGATGNKTATLSVPVTAARNGYMYRCVVSAKGDSVISDAATLKVKAAITTQPSNKTQAIGTTAKFTVAATGVNVAYQWQVSTDDGANWKNSGSTGNKTTTLSIPVTAARNGYKYRCKVTDINNHVTSKAVTLKVKAVITAQPEDQTLEIGKTAKFTVAASGVSVSYQWQISTNGGSTWKDSGATGNKTATLSVPVTAARHGYKYRCVVTDVNNQVTSSAAALYLKNPAITAQPASVSVATGSATGFTVTAVAADSYQWQVSSDGGNTWKNSGASSAKTANLKVNATAATAKVLYRCAVSNANGTAYSESVYITLTDAKPIIRTQPENVTAASGTKAEFSVVAPGTTSYQWQVSSDNGNTWKDSGASTAKTATLKVNATSATAKVLYRCEVANEYGTVYSDSVKITLS